MRKEWLWVGAVAAAVLLSACTTTEETQAPVQQAYNGPVTEIGGVEPHYEPYNPGTLQDYKVNGDTYRIVQDPQNFSQTGLAAWYGEEANGNTTAIGEQFESQCADRCTSHLAYPELCTRHQPGQWPSTGGTRERSRPLYLRPDYRICPKLPPIASTCPATPR